MASDDYFLSAENPIATTDQRRAEDTALRLIARPEMQKARDMVEHLFRWVVTQDVGEQIENLPAFVDEYMFHYALRAANSDPNDPKVVRFMVPPHRWFGRDVPGSRWAGDSPDFIYRTAAISFGPRYELHGRVASDPPPKSYYSLMEDRPAAPTILSLLEDIEIGSDGTFVITIDPSPADGRRNHIQTRPRTWQIWNRDALGDWAAESCNAMRIHRLDPPDRAPLTDEEMAERAGREAIDGVYYYYYLIRTSFLTAPNELRPPVSSHSLGGMASQYTCSASIRIKDDEAAIITASHSGATFRNAVLTDPFARTLNYWDQVTSLNSSQMAPDADGRFTYVLSHQDLGVHNWLDTSGLALVKFGQRWQSFEGGEAKETPTISSRVVKLSALDANLPQGVQRIDASGRREQIAARQAGFRKRFLDR
jgi:hypothetical protein